VLNEVVPHRKSERATHSQRRSARELGYLPSRRRRARRRIERRAIQRLATTVRPKLSRCLDRCSRDMPTNWSRIRRQSACACDLEATLPPLKRRRQRTGAAERNAVALKERTRLLFTSWRCVAESSRQIVDGRLGTLDGDMRHRSALRLGAVAGRRTGETQFAYYLYFFLRNVCVSRREHSNRKLLSRSLIENSGFASGRIQGRFAAAAVENKEVAFIICVANRRKLMQTWRMYGSLRSFPNSFLTADAFFCVVLELCVLIKIFACLLNG
jgi:hypothetical protein